MTERLIAKFAPAFSRDLKKKATKRQWDLKQLESVIDLVVQTPQKPKRRYDKDTICTDSQANGAEATSAM